jgi:pyruvate formate lyase activating enzyme
MLFEPEGDSLRCHLCGHRCLIGKDALGVCRVRKNVGGQLVTLNYDRVVAVHVDPIEKKPLFHFLPGSTSLSIAAEGCNFQCAFCQNWQISQAPRAGHINGEDISPQQIVAAAKAKSCASISYTYTEPTVFFELAYDTAVLARQAGIRNCFVSNGYMTPEAVGTIAPYLDAINVDLKAFREETYRRVMKASLAPVLECLRALAAHHVWTEVTTLVVPGMNDSRDELADIARFIAGQLGPDVPWHVSRFHGDYRMEDAPATPVEELDRTVRLGKQAGLHYVYSGNVPGEPTENTYCPSCGKLLIARHGFLVRSNDLTPAGTCPNCGVKIAGVWK